MADTSQHDDTILIVDDDESIRQTLQMALEWDHYATATVADGEEALDWLRQHPLPSLILLDLMMPVMNGWQVLEELRMDNRLARVPVVVITAFGRELGSASQLPVLRKPIELEDLQVAVAKHRAA